MKRLLAVFGIILFFLQASAAGLDAELLRRAAEAGITAEQLESLLPGTDTPKEEEASAPREAVFRTSRPDPPQKADSLESEEGPAIFGADFFGEARFPFQSNDNIPVPQNYTLGPGDELLVDLWGASTLNLRGKIDPQGRFHLGAAGPVQLSGRTLGEARAAIAARLRTVAADAGSGSRVEVTLGEIRAVNVHVVGEARVPGTYTLSALSTVLGALYRAGGPGEIGSLREIRLVRNNGIVSRTDIYRTLMDGGTESNVRLEEGDVILVPPYRARASIGGEVKREAVYELREGETLADLLRYAGGFRGGAYRAAVPVHRRAGSGRRIHTVAEGDFAAFPMQDGDSVAVGAALERYANRLTIRGAVWRPGEYEYGPAVDSLSALIARAEGLRGDQFADRGRIVRRRADFTTELLPFSVAGIVSGRTDIALQPEDEVYIPTIEEMTERRRVIVRGEVNRPDTLEYHLGMTVEDAIVGAGGLKESASLARTAVVRRLRDPDAETYSGRLAETFSFHIQADLSLPDEGAGFALEPFDEVYVRRSPVWFARQGAEVSGEILFGGHYAFARVGERLSELIVRAGGVTPEGYTRGASLVRTMTLDERAGVEAKLAMTRADPGRDSVGLEALEMSTTYSVGIDLEKALRAPGGTDDVVLRDGDVVYIPKLDNTVKISGSVLYANTVTFEGGKLEDYLSQAGGYTDGARRRPFIVYMNGKIASTRSGFLHRRYPRVEPGCEIVVPERTARGGRVGVSDILNIASSSTAIAAMLATILK